jgi:hypothetical protein
VPAKELFVRLAQGAAVHFQQRASGDVDSHRQSCAIESDQAGRQTRDNSFAELLCRIRAFSCFSTEPLEFLPLFLKLRND